jgi:hypothetical protein
LELKIVHGRNRSRLHRYPFVTDLRCLVEKDPRVPKPNGRAVFLCLGFALKTFDFRHGETDSPAHVMGFDSSGFSPKPESFWSDFPAGS